MKRFEVNDKIFSESQNEMRKLELNRSQKFTDSSRTRFNLTFERKVIYSGKPIKDGSVIEKEGSKDLEF